ncbi:methyltransferase type 11 [Sporormia fimetaria CBS 119925]|uniref:Methyltransferase type 11 n=1 Tax=Sporormia fimetaria CBS 119925 TaxID=1340428 RepID=A0A6A6V6L1_9PLEO|nr:methyltransferase type 11 [Sporormia fimetaria CBS 119925]
MPQDPKTTVKEAYDEIAEWYLAWAQNHQTPRERYTRKMLSEAGDSPYILELGCGAGVPVTRMLLDSGSRVVANDISDVQLKMAKTRCPEATFIAGDMTELSFEEKSFDGVVSFFTIFHLPRSEQEDMLRRIYGWLKPGVLFVFNLATLDEEEIHGEFLGHGMFWSSYGVEENEAMIRRVGYEILELEVLEAGDGKLDETDPDYGVKFVWIAARKPV